jgi:uncharacterized protein (TIGR03086 family)
MENLNLLRRAVGETNRLVGNITPEQLADPTPCTEWTIRDLINHVTGGSTMFAISAEEGSVPDDVMGRLMGGDNLGDDYKGALAAATGRALAAFDDPGMADKTVKLPFGEMPAGVALNIAVFDVTTHAADLAHATGQSVQDPELLDAALAIGRQMIGPELRQPGVFDAEQPSASTAASADRLLAFAGRRL